MATLWKILGSRAARRIAARLAETIAEILMTRRRR
jgi:hypothetical protein